MSLRTTIFCIVILLLTVFVFDLRADELRLKAGIAAMKRQHYATALRAFRAEAEEGNLQAKSNIGYMYEHGWGVPQDGRHWRVGRPTVVPPTPCRLRMHPHMPLRRDQPQEPHPAPCPGGRAWRPPRHPVCSR